MKERIYARRQEGGGGFMLCGVFCARDMLPLVVLESTINLNSYCELLVDYLLLSCEKNYLNGLQAIQVDEKLVQG